MQFSNSEIQAAIAATTGIGDSVPNAHRIKSYLGYIRPPGEPLHVDYGESFDQIAKYIWENYGIKTMLSDVTVMSAATGFYAEYYTRPSSSYIVTEEERADILLNNDRISNGLSHNEKRGRRRAGHHNTEW